MNTSHRRIRERFGRTAERFAASAAAGRLSPVAPLLDLASPTSRDVVLDVACGPGRLLAAVAPRVRFAVGVDLTPEMLRIARRQDPAGGGRPPAVVLAVGERLPFRDGAFSLVTTTLAVHHYEDPRRVVAEMARVCRSGGRIAVADLVGSDDEARRARANAIERLRDPSHVKMLSAAGLRRLLTGLGLEVLGSTSGSTTRELGEWCRLAATPADVVPRVRAMLLETREGDLAGMAPVVEGDEVRFRHDWVSIVCRRP